MTEFQFEGFNIRLRAEEQRRMETAKRVKDVETKVLVFEVSTQETHFDLLYCQAINQDYWITIENVESPSKHLQRLDRRVRMSIDFYKDNAYCRLWQELKEGDNWSKRKKVLSLAEFGKYSSQLVTEIMKTFDALALGRLENIVNEKNRTRNENGVLFAKDNLKIPIIVYLLGRVFPLL